MFKGKVVNSAIAGQHPGQHFNHVLFCDSYNVVLDN